MVIDVLERGAEAVPHRLVRAEFVPRGTHGPAPEERAAAA
jgi:hypothetical protein